MSPEPAATEVHDEVFAAHQSWVAGLRAQYESSCRRPVDDVQPSGFCGFGDFGATEPQLHEPQQHEAQLHERFNDAVDFDDEPVYRSLTDLSWQPANDGLDFDSDRPVYRSLGGLADAEAQGDVEMDSHAAWMQSMPPLVQRQKAFKHP